jgi:phosphatidylinositol-3-phosphatase
LLAGCAFLPGAGAAEPPVPSFEHVVVIVFENKAPAAVLGNAAAPEFNSFASRNAVLTRYSSITHPSLPNYLALLSGSTHGISSDCTDCLVSGRSLADTLEKAHRTWKTYAEGLPRPGWTGCCSGRYAKKHVPFLYFRNVVTRPASLRRVVPLRQLSRDLAARRLPDFSLVVPDLCHDMHDCSLRTGDAWLGRFLPPLLRSRQLSHAVVLVVFDEPPVGEGNLVPALAIGPLVRRRAAFASPTSHYGLLRTIEDAWGLPHLGRSARAAPITGIWR